MRFISALRLILTLHCEQSTELVSRSLDQQLAFAERWAVRLHFLSCWSCRRFRKQLLVIQHAAAQRGEIPTDDAADTTTQLSAEAQQRIIAAIRELKDQ